MVVELHAGAAFVPFDVVKSVSMDGPAEGLAGPGDDRISGSRQALFGQVHQRGGEPEQFDGLTADGAELGRSGRYDHKRNASAPIK